MRLPCLHLPHRRRGDVLCPGERAVQSAIFAATAAPVSFKASLTTYGSPHTNNDDGDKRLPDRGFDLKLTLPVPDRSGHPSSGASCKPPEKIQRQSGEDTRQRNNDEPMLARGVADSRKKIAHRVRKAQMLHQAKEPHPQATGDAGGDSCEDHHEPHTGGHECGIRRRRKHVRLRTLRQR